MRVEGFTSLSSLVPWERALTRLNLESTRPSPFHTLPGLEAYAGSDTPLILVAFDPERAVGMLPLRQSIETLHGLSGLKLQSLSAQHGLQARHEDELRVSHAFMQHLTTRSPSYSLLELDGLRPDSLLAHAATSLEGFKLGVELVETHPTATVPLAGGVEGWFLGLDHLGPSLMRKSRALLAAGEVELVSCQDPRAGSAMLSLYFDLEARSSKVEARSGIGADPKARARYTSLAANGPLLFHWLLLDGLPVAGLITLPFGDTAHQLESTCDEAFAAAGPDELLFLLAVRDLAERGAKTLELDSDLALRHERFGAHLTPTQAVQVYQRLGTHHLGRLVKNLTAGPEHEPPPTTERRTVLGLQLKSRTRAAQLFDRLDHEGVHFKRLWGDALTQALPFGASSEPLRRAV